MKKHYSLLHAICEGTMGHLIFLSRCKLYSTISELSFYPTIGLIASSQGWDIHCQYYIKEFSDKRENRSIDFVLSKDNEKIGLEVKWIPNKRNDKPLNLEKDIRKLLFLKNESIIKSGIVFLIGKPKFEKVKDSCNTGKYLLNQVPLSKRIDSNSKKHFRKPYDKFVRVSKISVGGSVLTLK